MLFPGTLNFLPPLIHWFKPANIFHWLSYCPNHHPNPDLFSLHS